MDEHSRSLFSRIRLRNVRADVTLAELKSDAERMWQLEHYSSAARFLTLAIDKMQTMYVLTKEERVEMSRMYKKRASCNLKSAEKKNSPQLVEIVLEDCKFVLTTGVFHKDLPRDVNREMEYIRQRAEELKEKLTRRRLRHKAREQLRLEKKEQKRGLNNEAKRIRNERKNAQCPGRVDALTCMQIVNLEVKVYNDIRCICNDWDTFVDPSIVIRAACGHAYCPHCLIEKYKVGLRN